MVTGSTRRTSATSSTVRNVGRGGRVGFGCGRRGCDGKLDWGCIGTLQVRCSGLGGRQPAEVLLWATRRAQPLSESDPSLGANLVHRAASIESRDVRVRIVDGG